MGPQADRIEGLAGRLDADFREHGGLAGILQRKPIGERLGHRLQRERLPRVAHLVDVAVASGDADAEPFGIDLRKFRYVVGDLAVSDVAQPRVKRDEIVLYRR